MQAEFEQQTSLLSTGWFTSGHFPSGCNRRVKKQRWRGHPARCLRERPAPARGKNRSCPCQGLPSEWDTLSLDNPRLRVYTIYVVVSNAMPLRRFSTMTPARFDAPLAATLRNLPVRTSFDRAEMPKNSFFVTFEAGMLLKTRESQTKYTSSERIFRRKCEGFAIFRTNCWGFAGFEANPEAYWDDGWAGVRCQGRRKSQDLTTPPGIGKMTCFQGRS